MAEHAMASASDRAGRPELTRRQMVEMALTVGAVPLLGAMGATAAEPNAAEPKAPEPKAPEMKRKIKLGQIGCGGRGMWIANLFKQHGGYELHAVSDYFQATADRAGETLGVDKARRFAGLSGYKKLLGSGLDAVVIIDVPYFYPEQAKAAVDAGCHVYMAKPVATDVPGCLMHEATGKLATQKKLCMLVDYQLPLAPPNIEVATRARDGALGPLAHLISYGFSGAWGDPAKGLTIEDRLRGGTWLSDVALGGDNIVSYDIHIIDGVTWLMGGKRPVSACGRSRTCRPNPHGDRTDCGAVVYEYDDGLLWTHLVQALNNNMEVGSLTASLYGLSATAHIAYWGKVFVRGGPKHYVADAGSVYDEGAVRNIADFYQSVTEGRFENPTVKRAVDGTLTAILGREASARRCFLTMDDLIKENKRLEVDLSGLTA